MLVRSATAVSFLIEFESGYPDSNVVWEVLAPDGSVLDSGAITPVVDAVSVTLTVDATNNSLGVGEYLSYRDVVWSYEVGGAVVNGEARYSVEARLPMGISADGVRSKLGVSDIELPDEDIKLASAFLSFQATITEPILTAAIANGSYDYVLKDAVEALAALKLIPSMSVRVAKKEDSGTRSFQRQDVDWLALGAYLTELVTAGYVILVPTFDQTVGFGALFILAGPSEDAYTGTTAA